MKCFSPIIFVRLIFMLQKKNLERTLPGIGVKRLCLWPRVYVRVCFCVNSQTCRDSRAHKLSLWYKNKHTLGLGSSFLQLHSFRNVGLDKVKGACIWSWSGLDRNVGVVEAFPFSSFDCNANDNYAGSPSQPLIFPPSQKKQLDSTKKNIDPPGLSALHEYKTRFFWTTCLTQSGAQLPNIYGSFPLFDLKWFVSLDRVLKCRLASLWVLGTAECIICSSQSTSLESGTSCFGKRIKMELVLVFFFWLLSKIRRSEHRTQSGPTGAVLWNLLWASDESELCRDN